MRNGRNLTGLLIVIAVLLVFSGPTLAGNRQLMSEKMAKQDLERNLVESVIGYKVMSKGQFGLTQEAEYKVQEKAGALIKGIRVEKMIYDKQKDIAFCTGYIDLGDVENILGDRIRYKNVRVNSFGFGTMTADSRPPLMALRAALLNAYDEMASTIVGEKISSFSESENFVLTKDINKSEVCAAVFGAYIPDINVDSRNRGWGWDQDGNAFVKLDLDLKKVQDILGQRIIYKGPNIIEVIGRGSQTDDLQPTSEEATSLISPGGAKTEYRSLDIPSGQQSELKGKYDTPGKQIQQ